MNEEVQEPVASDFYELVFGVQEAGSAPSEFHIALSPALDVAGD